MPTDRPHADIAPASDDGLEAGRERAWRMLDLLPKGEPHPSLAATTIEMSAVSAAARGGDGEHSYRSRWKGRALAAALLAASLAAGFLTGSRSRGLPGDPFAMAIGRHLAVLREAGSVEFLRTFARREIPPPRRPGGPRPPEETAPTTLPYPELDAAIADFRAALEAAGQPAATRDPGRLDEAMRSVERLTPGERHAFAALARALSDPRVGELVEAARRWHEWVEASDPVERRILPTLGPQERLEWLARRGRPWRPPGPRGPLPPPGPGRPPPAAGLPR